MQKITPFLWFDTHAEEAMTFYTSLFGRSRVVSIERYPEGPLDGPMKGMEGRVLTGIFELEGQQFMALDGGPTFNFTPAISFFVSCETVDEFNRLWARLSDGGGVLMEPMRYPFSERYGWLSDKYGMTWQLSVGHRDQKIAPSLLFVGKQHGKAESAMKYYTSLFANSRIENIERYGQDEGGEPGAVKHAVFRLHGQEFMAMESNLNHAWTFNEAVSLYVECGSQAEVDHFWESLSADPKAEQCGWLKDRYGVSWQIIPTALPRLLNDPDPEAAKRVMDAMLKMKKIEVAALQRAAEGVRV